MQPTIFMSIPKQADNCYGMRSNGYYAHIMNPGELDVIAAIYKKQKDFTISMKAGDRRFIKISFGTWGSPEYEEVSEERGIKMISKSRQISAFN